MIRTHDHEPPHVHCIKAGAEVLIEIENGSIRRNRGMKSSDVRSAIALVMEHQETLRAEWRRRFQ